MLKRCEMINHCGTESEHTCPEPAVGHYVYNERLKLVCLCCRKHLIEMRDEWPTDYFKPVKKPN